MTTITIPAAAIPARATYIRHVLEAGHIPGVLSGAELKGKAKGKHGASYNRARGRAAAIAAAHGIKQALVLLPTRGRICRVWVDASGNPARLAVG